MYYSALPVSVSQLLRFGGGVSSSPAVFLHGTFLRRFIPPFYPFALSCLLRLSPLFETLFAPKWGNPIHPPPIAKPHPGASPQPEPSQNPAKPQGYAAKFAWCTSNNTAGCRLGLPILRPQSLIVFSQVKLAYIYDIRQYHRWGLRIERLYRTSCEYRS